jgi:hypothetical protein
MADLPIPAGKSAPPLFSFRTLLPASKNVKPSASIRFSNGCGIYALDTQEKPRLIFKDNLIEDTLIG